MNKIPIYQPSLRGNERKYVLDCIDSNWISSKGAYVSKFEEAVAEYVGGVSATSCSNGTVALHLALLALDIGPGDEVIVPSFTYIASVNAIRYVGAIPVFVDSDPLTWNISIETIKEALTPSTKAIMCVHIYGVPCDLAPILEFAEAENLKIIEDCAEALGSHYVGRHVGVSADIATFSFFGNKTLTTGEGGMVFSKDSTLIDKVAHLKNQAVSKTIDYWHDAVGYNYRLTNIASAIGLAQIEEIQTILTEKARVAQHYRTLLQPHNIVFQEVPDNSVSSFWLNVARLPSVKCLASAIESFQSQGIEVRPAFPLVSEMPPYKTPGISNFPNVDVISSHSLCLPSFPDLTSRNVELISDLLIDSLTHA